MFPGDLTSSIRQPYNVPMNDNLNSGTAPVPSVSPVKEPCCCRNKSSRWFCVILTAIVGFLVLASVAYAAFLYGQKTAPVVSLLQNTGNVSQPVVADKTSSWETYKYVPYGIEFKYPSDKMKVTLQPASIRVENKIVPSGETINGGELYFDIMVGSIPANTTLNSWVQSWNGSKNLSEMDIVVDGVSAVKLFNPNYEPKTENYIFVMKDGQEVQVSGSYLNLPPDSFYTRPYYKQLKDLWLEMDENFYSTIKLTNQKDETAK